MKAKPGIFPKLESGKWYDISLYKDLGFSRVKYIGNFYGSEEFKVEYDKWNPLIIDKERLQKLYEKGLFKISDDQLNEMKAKPGKFPPLEVGKFYDIAEYDDFEKAKYEGKEYGMHLFSVEDEKTITLNDKDIQWYYQRGFFKLADDQVNEASFQHQKPSTKVIQKDPESNSITWSVSYKPDFNGLINYMDKLIKKYRDTIKRNKLDRDADVIKNFEYLKIVRKELVKMVKEKYPELLDKLFQTESFFNEMKAKPGVSLANVSNKEELKEILNGPKKNLILDFILDNYTEWTLGEFGDRVRNNFHAEVWRDYNTSYSLTDMIFIRDNADDVIYLTLKQKVGFNKINLFGLEVYIDFA